MEKIIIVIKAELELKNNKFYLTLLARIKRRISHNGKPRESTEILETVKIIKSQNPS